MLDRIAAAIRSQSVVEKNIRENAQSRRENCVLSDGKQD